ncbi:MAG: spore coat protein CotJB [Oscillospiraceae bacterium]|nr:spore coat protein CotJB [Oscillospiraceae bacterium]
MMQRRSLDKMERDELLDAVRQCRFYMTDLSLYLDTHPTDENALALFTEHKAMFEEYAAEYAKRFGALKQCQTGAEYGWAAWSNTPWPWEKEAN